MPQIIITTSGPGEQGSVEVHRERLHAADLSSDMSSNHLVERIGWALSDAQELETDRYEEQSATGFTRDAGSIADTAVH